MKPPLDDLRMSPQLQAADPTAMARRAAAVDNAAGLLGQQADRLSGLGRRMQSGVWVSPAGAGFVASTAEESRRIVVAAGLLRELGAALTKLAAALASARADAVSAVARSRQINPGVDDLDQQVRAREAAALEDAESRARRAWQQAQSDFDLVGYASPGMRRQMLTGAWDPAASVALGSVAAAVSCGPMNELALPGGGRLTGPDGRSYDLVVQTARGSDGRLLVSTREQPADAVGWRRLAVRTGLTEYGPKASGWDKLAVALGGVAGAPYPEGSTFAPGLLGELHIMAGGGAYLPDAPDPPSEPGGSTKEAPAEAPRGKDPARYWVAPATGLASGRKASTPDGIGLLNAGIGGFLLAGRLDDGRAAAYRVVFEESPTGERRARLQLYRIVAAPGQAPTTDTAGGYVDKSGHLAGIAVTGEAPNRHPIMTEAHH
jgi:hypothetical protein